MTEGTVEETAEETAEGRAGATAERPGGTAGRAGAAGEARAPGLAVPALPEPEAPEGRDRYIPIRKAEIVAAVLDDPSLGAAGAPADRAALEGLARRLGLIFHIDYYARREAIKDLYVRFNPDQPGEGPVPADPDARQAFLDALDSALIAANFTRLTQADLAEAEETPGRVRAKIRIPRESFDEVRFYGRGRRSRPVEIRRWFGLRRETQEMEVYDHIVFAAVISPEAGRKTRRRHDARLRPGAIYLKLFRNIAKADLDTLYPNAKAVMAVKDIAILVVPAVAGGIPILLNLLPAVTVLLVVVGAYLGIQGTVEEDATKKALAALSGLGALGGFIARQWIKYERQALKYAMQVANNAYFNNMSNNAGFFDQLVGASEESEVKEAFLAYAFLHAEGPLTEPALDARIEAWLKARFGADVDFEIDDALGKLDRLDLVDREGDLIRARPLAGAAAKADEAWARLGAATCA